MKYFTILSSLLAVVSASPSSERPVKRALPPNLARDTLALQTFAKSVSSDPKGFVKTWVGANPCAFKGVFCTRRNDAIEGVDINGAHLGGDIHLTNFLEKLTDIGLLHANSNGFSGDLPDISGLQNLKELDLSNNKFTSIFPKGIFRAPRLIYLDLRYNQFQGSLPPGLFHTHLDVAFLNNNRFTGDISPEIGKSLISYLNVANNGLSGAIPESIADMRYLKQGLFMNNALTGGIPEKLCAKRGIEILDFSGNRLTQPLGPACLALKKARRLIV
ncbi:hypothetical protein EG327_006455 [Venturia inaequalis]|uniref:Cell wall hydroxyproline-rich glycoprotein n=1 Tax=Venturia inaequalis TaxID=5025 RepID=A0A8H3ZH27_VENIN|nr:hypothetical protein EG327_006455 [Venturia inaequalis]